MNWLDRVRRFWNSPPAEDHPLSEQERDEDRPATGSDERARALQEFVGDDFDPDDPRVN
jgi:hypothetical protein